MFSLSPPSSWSTSGVQDIVVWKMQRDEASPSHGVTFASVIHVISDEALQVLCRLIEKTPSGLITPDTQYAHSHRDPYMQVQESMFRHGTRRCKAMNPSSMSLPKVLDIVEVDI